MKPVQQRSRWFDPTRLRPGNLAFMLHRATGIGLVVYLYLHLAVLFQLSRGAQGWDSVLTLMRSPLVLALDFVLLTGVIFHALNGLRLTALGLGIGLRWQKEASYVLIVLTLLLAAGGVFLIGGQP